LGLLGILLGIRDENNQIHYFDIDEVKKDEKNAYVKFISHKKKDREKMTKLKTILQKKSTKNTFYVGGYEESDKNNIFNLVVWIQFEKKIELKKLDLLGPFTN